MKRVKMKWSHGAEKNETISQHSTSNNQITQSTTPTTTTTTPMTTIESVQTDEMNKRSKKEKKEKKEKKQKKQSSDIIESEIIQEPEIDDAIEVSDLLNLQQSKVTTLQSQLEQQQQQQQTIQHQTINHDNHKSNQRNAPPEITGVVGIKIVKKRANEASSSSNNKSTHENSKKKLKKESTDEKITPLALLTKPTISSIGGGGVSQWE